MSTRDRWTVYPLLFLALGIALRSKVTSTIDVDSLTSRRTETTLVNAAQVTAKSVLCDDLQITGKDGKPRVRLGTTRVNTGGIEVYGRDGNLVAAMTVDPDTDRASLRLQTADGTPQVTIGSDSDGGILEVHSKTGQPQVLIHSMASGGVVTTIDAEGNIRIDFGKRVDESAPPADNAAPKADPAKPQAK